MRQPRLIAKRKDTAIAACGAHREHQNALNVIHEDYRVNADLPEIRVSDDILAS